MKTTIRKTRTADEVSLFELMTRYQWRALVGGLAAGFLLLLLPAYLQRKDHEADAQKEAVREVKCAAHSPRKPALQQAPGGAAGKSGESLVTPVQFSLTIQKPPANP